MIEEFSALAAAAQQIDKWNCFVVVVAEWADGSGRRVEVQRSLKDTDQDRRLGMDTHCVCLENGASEYGSVASWMLAEDVLTLMLNEKGVKTFGVDGFRILIADRSKLEQVGAGLQRILGPPEKSAIRQ